MIWHSYSVGVKGLAQDVEAQVSLLHGQAKVNVGLARFTKVCEELQLSREVRHRLCLAGWKQDAIQLVVLGLRL